MNRRVVYHLCLVAVVGLFLPAPTPAQQPSGDTPAKKAPDLAQVAALVTEQTNRFRAENRLAPVQENASLTAAARQFAEFMAETTKYGHRADGRQTADRTAEHGYEHCLVLENIAYRFRQSGFTTEELATGFVDGWKDSPSHRQAMLDPDVRETGVAVARSSTNSYFYAVQVFGRPKPMQIAFQVYNASSSTIQYTISCADGDKAMTVPPRATATHVRCRNAKVIFPASNQAAALEPIEGYYLIHIDAAGRLGLQRKAGRPAGTEDL
jgi:uncharacterized protein YkwD